MLGIDVKLSSFLSGIIIYSIGINVIMLIKVNFRLSDLWIIVSAV